MDRGHGLARTWTNELALARRYRMSGRKLVVGQRSARGTTRPRVAHHGSDRDRRRLGFGLGLGFRRRLVALEQALPHLLTALLEVLGELLATIGPRLLFPHRVVPIRGLGTPQPFEDPARDPPQDRDEDDDEPDPEALAVLAPLEE